MTLPVLAIIAFSTLVTSFISGILGMAGGMILMGVLIALLPLPAAMMLHGITQLASNGWRAAMLRQAIDWRVFRGYAIGVVIALAVFALIQIVASKPTADYDAKVPQPGTTGDRFIGQLYAELGGK